MGESARDGRLQEASGSREISDRREWELVRHRFLQRLSPLRAMRKLHTNKTTCQSTQQIDAEAAEE